MYQHFQNNFKLAYKLVTEDNHIDFPFRASFTQRKRIINLSNKLGNSKQFNDQIEKLALSLDLPIEKLSANNVISYLENKINPINTAIYKKIDSIFSPFTQIGVQVQFDKKLEKRKFTLKMDINGQTNISNFANALNSFNYNDIEEVWNGKFDV